MRVGGGWMRMSMGWRRMEAVGGVVAEEEVCEEEAEKGW